MKTHLITHIRRLLVCLWAAVLLLEAVVYAAPLMPDMALEVDEAHLTQTGDEVVLTVTLTNAEDVAAATVIPTYDRAVFEPVRYAWDPDCVVSDYVDEYGNGVCAFAESVRMTGRVLFSITLRAVNIPEGEMATVGCRVILHDSRGENYTLPEETVTVSLHRHTWGAYLSYRGEHFRTCLSCGVETPPEAHHLEETALLRPAGCEQEGLCELTCDVCGHSETATVAAEGHRYETVTVPPTCEEAGTRSGICAVCGAETPVEELSPTGHTWVTSTQEPTCTEVGYERTACSVCHQSQGETILLPTIEHRYENGTCTMCGRGETVTTTFCVMWIVGDEVVTETYTAGDMPVYEGVPTRPDEAVVYLFAGWDANGDGVADPLAVVAGDVIYEALFDCIVGIHIQREPERVSYLVGEAFSAAGLEVEALYSDGRVRLLGTEELTVVAADTAEAGQSAYEVRYGVLATTGYVTVLPALERGDLDGDGVLDSNDAIYLLRHTLRPDRYPLSQSGDVNGDGLVDSQDAIYLLRHTMRPDRYPLA